MMFAVALAAFAAACSATRPPAVPTAASGEVAPENAPPLAADEPARKIAVLVEMLGDEEAWLRATAAENLGRMGPAAKAAVPALRKALGDEDRRVRAAAFDALTRIEPPPTQPAINAP